MRKFHHIGCSVYAAQKIGKVIENDKHFTQTKWISVDQTDSAIK